MRSEEKDDEIIWVVNELRLATRKHIGQCLPKRNNSWLHESLTRMVAQKKLYSVKSEVASIPFIYAVYNIKKRTDFEHDLPLSDIHVALWNLIVDNEWHQSQQKQGGALNQDVWCLLGKPDEFSKNYVEHETGKNRWDQVDDRLTRYIKLREREFFNVVYVLKNEKLKTVQKYVSRAEKFLDPSKPSTWKLFLFTTLEQITANPRGQIFKTAFDPEPCYLLPPDLLK